MAPVMLVALALPRMQESAVVEWLQLVLIARMAQLGVEQAWWGWDGVLFGGANGCTRPHWLDKLLLLLLLTPRTPLLPWRHRLPRMVHLALVEVLSLLVQVAFRGAAIVLAWSKGVLLYCAVPWCGV